MELISFILESNGFKVLKAFTGNEGYHMALENDPDIILLDIQLPDIDGLEVLKRIREKGLTEVPIIAVTSYAMTGDKKNIIDAGCDGYIEKPIDAMNVISQIEKFFVNS